MQPLAWYWRRLRTMGPREVAWRARTALQDGADWVRVNASPSRDRAPAAPLEAPAFEIGDVSPGEWLHAPPGSPEAAWRDRLIARAEPLVAHRLAVLGLEPTFLGEPIDWNRDHESGRRAPLQFSPFLDYRDYERVGDAKLVWEPNRHQHLVTLARAYRATGDPRYARSVAAQLDSWLDQCPFGRGMNWRSPLELAIRLINWAWTLGLVRGSGAVAAELEARLRRSLAQHVAQIARRYSTGSSANNHRIGEAAGVFVATSVWPGLEKAGRRREESLRILGEEILAQTHEDGGTREQAVGYHQFVLQFFLVVLAVARRTGQPLPDGYEPRLQSMLEFLGALGEGGERLPMIGDADDGIVLDLGDERDPAGWLAAGAVLFGRPDFKQWSGGYRETARWLLGREGGRSYDAIPTSAGARALTSRALPASGYYLLQGGEAGTHRAVSVVFDCGELGFSPLAAHGHADALSLTLRVGGRDVMVDPGTFDYFRSRAWRDYFRSTRAHNTVSVDGQDQSVMEGPFLWGPRARARCLAWEPRPSGGRIVAEHDGYTRLPDPVRHRRTLELDASAGTLLIVDEIEGAGEHEIALHFHFAEDCRLQPEAPSRVRVAFAGGTLRLELDPRLALAIAEAGEDPIAGWVSRGYHRKAPAPELVARARGRGPSSLITRIRISVAGEPHVRGA
jgi:hypothetical protein